MASGKHCRCEVKRRPMQCVKAVQAYNRQFSTIHAHSCAVRPRFLSRMFLASLLRHARSWRGRSYLRTGLILALTLLAYPAFAAETCDGARNVRLDQAVQINPDILSELASVPVLRVASVEAPPLVHFDPTRGIHEGVAVDILCFVAGQLGIRTDFLPPDPKQSVPELLRSVQEGEADVFIPASHSPERAELGLFSGPIFVSYYAVIGRQGSPIAIQGAEDLAQYKVGFVSGVNFQNVLEARVPSDQLFPFDRYFSGELFNALKQGLIDVAIFNQHAFTEQRYRDELFDLEVKYTLYEYPRTYRFYFTDSPANERLVEAINQYLPAIDPSQSVILHQHGERELLERYVSQRHQRSLYMVASAVAAVLALLAIIALIYHRRLMQVITERNIEIERQRRALYEANVKLEALSRTDPLTGVANRRYFDERANREYARMERQAGALSLMLIDVDHFKVVNDCYGHLTGDAYLQKIAQVLKQNVGRVTDTVARYGGEEFVCLLPDISADDARKLAERIRSEVEALHLPNAAVEPPWVTVSIGVASLKGDAHSLQEMFSQADSQLYAAKQAGRNRVSCVQLPGKRPAVADEV